MIAKRKHTLVATCLLLFVMSASSMLSDFSFAEVSLEVPVTSPIQASAKQVDVGIVYGANNQYPIGVTSEQGFLFGQIDNGKLLPLINLSEYKNIVLYKDGFYDASGRTLVTSSQTYYTTGQVKGGYHIQIGSSYDTYDQVLPVLLALQGASADVYLVCDNGWRIYSGVYVTAGEASIQLDAVKAMFLGYEVAITVPNPSSVIVSSKDKILFSFDSSEKTFLFNTTLFEVNSVVYRNSFIVKRLPGSDFTFINRVAMNEYLYGVLPKEMSGSWPLEALKAQAIASKNYVLTAGNKYASYGFDVTNTVSSQVYGGYSAEKPLCNQAVDETLEFNLLSLGKIVPLYFHSNSGGITDDAENVWSSTLPYIKSTIDPYSVGSPNTDWTAKLYRSDIEQKLIVGGYNIGSLKNIRIVERAYTGRVTKIEFEGSSSKATLSKDKIRSVLGSTVIKSLLFSFDQSTALTVINAQTLPAITAPEPLANQLLSPIVMTSNSGIFGKFIDATHVSVEENGKTNILFINKSALRIAMDIYKTPDKISVPYQYSATESIDMSSGSVVFYGHGYGHGLGMSQWGAKKMADEGKTFREILLFYYNDTQLVSN